MPVVSLEEAYCILGLEVGASEDEVRRSYKKLALRTHPDKNPDDAHAHKKFLQISEAYKRITDPDSFKEEEEGGEPSEEEMQAMFNMMFAEMMGFGSRGGGFGGIPMSMFEMFDGMMDDEMDEDEYGNPYGSHYNYEEDDEDDEEDYYFEGEEDGDEDFHMFMQGGGAGGSMVEAMLMEALMQEQFGMGGEEDMFFGRRGGLPSQSQRSARPAAAASKINKNKKNSKKDKKSSTINKSVKNKKENNQGAKKSPTSDNIQMSPSKPVHDNSDDNNDGEEEEGDWETDDSESHHLRKKPAKDVKHSNEVDDEEEDAWEDEDDEDGELDEMLMGMSEEELMFMMMTGMVGGPGAGRGRGMGGRGGGGPMGMMDMSMLEMLAGGMGGGGKGSKHLHQQSNSSSSKKATPNSSNLSSSQSSSAKSKTKKAGGKSTVIPDDDIEEAEPAIRFSGRTSSTSAHAPSATSTKPSSSSPRSTNNGVASVKVGDKVLVFGRHTGKVAFVGDVHYAKGTFVGVVMDDAKQGKNSGTVRGVEYFSCNNNRGLMVSMQDITKA